MIYDTIANAASYKGLSAALDLALDTLAATDFTALPAGRYAVDGDRVYYMVQEPTLKARPDTKWEAHRRYLDIQLSLTGGEGVEIAPLSDLPGVTPYDAEKDAAVSDDQGAAPCLPLIPGRFLVLWPQDAHRPGIHLDGPLAARKVVFKVAVE